MNILFIEDENELRESGVAQLELHGHTVYPVSNLADARAIMGNPAMSVHLVLADHRLSDGQGVHFVIKMKAQFPGFQYVIVSGCLIAEDMEQLKENDIPYFHKPLLYGKVVETFRRKHLSRALDHSAPSEEPSAGATDAVEAPSSDAEKPKGRWFGLLKK
ncbi:MAG: DNA-binding NtrC family response regulator [Lentimonas sp.]|jgi:DNA-binding NtrC family response regulator